LYAKPLYYLCAISCKFLLSDLAGYFLLLFNNFIAI